jgi:energy-coupling factor transporter ATP-binding protein EcfA2
MSSAPARHNPFPGLRSFEPDEDYLFFGRERQIDELVRRLRTHRFLAVVGTSGSGKSSLVRSGLIPSLQGGAMARAGSAWRVAILRPSGDPLGNLASALYAPGVLVPADGEEEEELARAFFATNLRASQNGLVDCVRQARLPAGHNVLVLVDQFEELFRFKRGIAAAANTAPHAEATAFVKLLLAAVHCPDLPIYIALTLRSDFIGHCMEFAGLPEEINAGLYLVPRLTRDELRSAIVGPVAVDGTPIAPRLVLRLLNDVGDNPDHLPILQHALMRTCDRWREEQEGSAFHQEGSAFHQEGSAHPEPLDLRHYEAVGTMAEALSCHAEEAYGELDPRGREIAALLWKALTDRGTDGRGIRRPAPLAEICALAGASEAEVAAVVERFRQSGRSFLMPPAGTPLDGGTILDISHESLMRIWDRLVRWAEDEASSARLYLGVARAAARHAEGTTALWRDPELQLALSWREREKPTAVWARRYDPGFERAMAFLDASREERDRALELREARRRRKLRRARQWAALLAGLLLLTAVFGVSAWRQRQIAEADRRVARRAEAEALLAKNQALETQQLAEQAMAREAAARQATEKALSLAGAKSKQAEEAEAEAQRQSRRADEAAAALVAARLKRPPKPQVTATAPASAPAPAPETSDTSSIGSRLNGTLQRWKDKLTGNGEPSPAPMPPPPPRPPTTPPPFRPTPRPRPGARPPGRDGGP